MIRILLRALTRGAWVAVAGGGLTSLAAMDKEELLMMRNVYHDAATAVRESYYPREKIDATFQQK